MERYQSNDQFGDACDPDALFHPSQAFGRPSEVVNHPDLTLNEKRAILGRASSSRARNASMTSSKCTGRFPPGRRRNVETLPERPGKVSRGSPDEECDHSLS
jgi:hypothetical protein